MGICPEYMSEKAVAIGTYCAASGAHVLFGVHNPVAGSPEVIKLMTEGWEKKTGGALEWEPDIDKLIAKALAYIDAKRAALGLAAYDPARYGQSGDREMEQMLTRNGKRSTKRHSWASIPQRRSCRQVKARG